MLQMRRSRGAFSGFLLVLLGLWGALIPFIGPYFHFAYTPDTAWTYNSARLWLEILPGAAVFLGGFFLLVATGRHIALFGSMLAAAAGAWFVLGTVLSPLWSTGSMNPGTPVGSTVLDRDTIFEDLISRSGGRRATVYGAALLDTVVRQAAELFLSQYLVTYTHPDAKGPLPLRVGVRGLRQGAQIFAPGWTID